MFPGKSQGISHQLDNEKDTVVPGNETLDTQASLEVPLSIGMEVSVPLFTLKYGNVSLSFVCDKADCHVDDLIILGIWVTMVTHVSGMFSTVDFSYKCTPKKD